MVTSGGGTSCLKISTTVDNVLRGLRSHRDVRYLWIDSICLNQEDDDEKAQQIPQMGSIYKQTEDVRIWLEFGGPTSSAMYNLFGEAECHESCRDVFDIHRCSFNRQNLAVIEYLDFFRQRWFSRRWIIQEVFLARKSFVHWDDYQVSFRTVAFFAFWLQSGFKADYYLNIAAPLVTERDSCSLLENLWHFHRAECGEKKDRVAALLCLSENDGFQLDYGSHWKQIYRDVAAFALRSENNDTRIQVLLHLFEFGPAGRLNDADCPSWVPDWSNTRTRDLPYHSRAANVDFGEGYLSSLEELSDKALLTMRDDILQIHPSPSMGGDQSWRVAYVKPPSNMACYEPSHVISMLDHLFPTSATESPIAVLHLSSLVYLISYHRPMQGWIESPEFDRFTEEVYDKLLEGRLDIGMGRYLHYKRSLSALRSLCALLHDFCLFDLRPRSRQASGADRALGLGPKDTLVNDVMVPLWRRRAQLLRSWGEHESASISITTMLVIRHDEALPQQAWHTNQTYNQTYEELGKQRGRIIGPALYVELSGDRGTYRSEWWSDGNMSHTVKHWILRAVDMLENAFR